jgi:CheY-like chemotaxis protein
MRMETETAGYDVIRIARQMPYDPATALLTAYPSLGNDWKSKGVQSLLVKPVNTQELLRQLEALLITHQDQKMMAQKSEKKTVLHGNPKAERQAAVKRAH